MLTLGLRVARDTDLWSVLDAKTRIVAPDEADREAADAGAVDAPAVGGGRAHARIHAFDGSLGDPLAGSQSPASQSPAGAGPINAGGAGVSTLIAQYFDAGDSRYEYSGNQIIDATLFGSKWTLATVTFSFPTSGSNYGGAAYFEPHYSANHADFNAAMKTAGRYAMTLVEGYTLLDLDEITETDAVHANIRMSQTDDDPHLGSASGRFPSSKAEAGDIWFGMTGQPFYTTPAIGNWGQATIMHEIGHTLGLKHGHSDNEFDDLIAQGYLTGAGPRYGSGPLPNAVDGQAWSLMTYRSDPANGLGFEGEGINQPQTYMQADIAALQYLYGADFAFRSTATTYTFSSTTGEMFVNGVGQGAPSGNRVLRTIWDGNGVDTYDTSNYTGGQSINLNPGEFSTFSTAQLANHRAYSGGTALAPGNIANALLYGFDARSYIENATTGSGADTIVGNAIANVLTGNGGNDTQSGASGSDVLNGGAGNDLLQGGFDSDTLNGGADNDTLFANTQAAPSGSVVGDQLNGGSGADTITGSNGADTIDGGFDTDRMLGGNGDDIISQNLGGPNETMDGGAGNDTGDWTYSGGSWVIDLVAGTANLSGTTYALLTSIENINGGSGDDSIDGGSAANSLNGGGGDDLLDGGGGYNDTLNGGLGNDTVDYSWIGGGFESFNIVLSLLAQSYADDVGTETWVSIENVIGSQTGETLIGNSSVNSIDGQGGADTIRGGNGYDNLNGGAGVDTIDYSEFVTLATSTIDLIAGTYFDGFLTETILNFENVIGTGGSQTILGTDDTNVLQGREANDTLDGRNGNDQLYGGDGDDRLIQGFGSGLEILNGGTGSDTGDWSFSGDNWIIDLAAGTAMIGATTYANLVAVENAVGSQGDDLISGTSFDNTLDGHEGDDTINDGAGDDIVDGGGGGDVFKLGDSIVVGDTWDGGLGFDIWDASAYVFIPGVEIDLGAGEWRFSGYSEVILNTEGARGSQGGETLLGSTDANLLDGQDGHDTIRGLAGADTLVGGLGDDLLQGGADNDSIDGGDGVDTLDYSDGAAAVSVDLGVVVFQNTGGSGFDRIAGVENLIGTAGADNLTGNGGANRLVGGVQADTLSGTGGADTLDGGQGADSLAGGAADDLVYGGFGPDTMIGGAGIDTLDFSVLAGEAFIDISIAIVQNTHSGGNDSLIGFENVITGAGDDRVFGSGQQNIITTADGADTVKAADGSDVIFLGIGDDRVNGGGGADYISGGEGKDFIRGGLLDDTFDYDMLTDSAVGVATCDILRDFRTSDGDTIDFSDLFAGVLAFIGAAAFGGVGTSEVRVGVVVQGQLVQVDIDGDGDSDLDLLVQGGGMSGGAGDFAL